MVSGAVTARVVRFGGGSGDLRFICGGELPGNRSGHGREEDLRRPRRRAGVRDRVWRRGSRLFLAQGGRAETERGARVYVTLK
jgi:hypothetical protein